MTTLCHTAVAGARNSYGTDADDGTDGASCARSLALPAADFANGLPDADASETLADGYARCLVENPGMTGSGSGTTGSGSGMTGSGTGMTAFGTGMTGSGSGMMGCGSGMTGSGSGMTGSGSGMTGSGSGSPPPPPFTLTTFAESMALTTMIHVIGVQQGNGVLSPFAGDQVRGVQATPSNPPFGPYVGTPMYQITIGADVGGEMLSFNP